MKPKVYIESSVVSYLVARPSNDLVKTARQTITEVWWADNLHHYSVYVSELVESEISQGDPEAASKRLAITEKIQNLRVSREAEKIADRLLSTDAVPAQNVEDALHIGIAAANGVEYLLTWNFKHINNATTKAVIRGVVESFGYECPEICSPEELRKNT